MSKNNDGVVDGSDPEALMSGIKDVKDAVFASQVPGTTWSDLSYKASKARIMSLVSGGLPSYLWQWYSI